MRYSHLFGKTTKTVVEDDKIISNKLLYQAGYIRESTAGRLFMLPLGMRVQQRIIKIVKEEMDRVGAQEMISPILHPLELWAETNRTNTTGFELMKVVDRREAEFALGGTAEEMFVDVVRKFNISYRDLPFHIYQFSTKFRDELRARGGLLRVREFVMKDGYSFDRDEVEFKKTYDEMALVYKKIFDRLGLKTIKVEADNGYIGGEYCHEFIVEHPVGESKFLMTEDGSYAAHEDVAKFTKEKKNVDEALKPLQEIDAVRGTTMEDGQKIHGLPMWQQIKDVLYVDDKGRFVLAILRGDFSVNEMKLCHVAKCITVRHATEEEIRDICHSEPGFISPVKFKENMKKGVELIIVADDSLRTVVNAYGGANAKHKDLLNINIDRDYKADVEGDIALAEAGFIAPDGTNKLIERRGIEVGNIFQLGYHYTKLMKGANFVDQDGKEKPYYMGCYGIGIGRTMAAIVETHFDDRGIMWPNNIAPYDLHLIGLDLQDEEIKKNVERIYHQLLEMGYTVLYDDRANTRAGEKFADYDLVGVPYRLVVSKKTGDKIEFKKRSEKDTSLVTLEDLQNHI
jgi:prolyl-tRNA synthetase